MHNISSLLKKYSNYIDYLDLELIIAYVLGKNREFVLTHPEHKIKNSQLSDIASRISRRMKHEPLAYILREKEFYGMKFKVNKNVLIPRPETEMIVDLLIRNVQLTANNTQHTTKKNNLLLIDVGTGSGNIIIAIAKNLLNNESGIMHYAFYGVDISEKALAIAKQNAKLHRVYKKIKFLHGNLIKPVIKEIKNWKLEIRNWKFILVCNLPYLSPKIYVSCSPDIKKNEPKLALVSQKEGLAHYEELLKQIGSSVIGHQSSVIAFIEISPEQRIKIKRLIKKYFPKSKTSFHKDLSGRNRVCELEIFNF